MTKTFDVTKDYYGILGISSQATPDDIRKAYRKKAIETHPDRNRENPDAAIAFSNVNEAYTVLSDRDLKGQYDFYRLAQPSGAGACPASQGFKSSNPGTSRNASYIKQELSRIFNSNSKRMFNMREMHDAIEHARYKKSSDSELLEMFSYVAFVFDIDTVSLSSFGGGPTVIQKMAREAIATGVNGDGTSGIYRDKAHNEYYMSAENYILMREKEKDSARRCGVSEDFMPVIDRIYRSALLSVKDHSAKFKK